MLGKALVMPVGSMRYLHRPAWMERGATSSIDDRMENQWSIGCFNVKGASRLTGNKSSSKTAMILTRIAYTLDTVSNLGEESRSLDLLTSLSGRRSRNRPHQEQK